MIENAIKYVKQIFADDCSGHDDYHTMRVYHLAMQIAEQENADMLIVQLAALLHDVDDVKLSPETHETKRNAVRFMKNSGVDDKVIASVCKIIDEVSFAGIDSVVPSTIEGKCVQDADRLDAMGAIGIARTFAYGGTESKIYSIFDYLYKQYTEERRVYLQKHKKVSEYDSENLMYSLLEDIISANKYSSLDVVCHFPLNMLIKNPELLNEQECQYAMNPATHLDFLIYNRIGKKPVLAIEVDGYEYHKEDTAQASRDLLKNHIMELYEIPLLRFMTNGSGEKEKIIEMLDKLVG